MNINWIAKKSAFILMVICVFCVNALNAEIIIDLSDDQTDNININVTELYYRRIIGTPNNEIEILYNDLWKYKHITYELYYDNKISLANDIYSLAIFSNDITEEVSLERFEKGVQGFHYDLSQVCDWINNNNDILNSPKKRQLFFYLLIDGIITYMDNMAVSTGKVKHVLGVAPGNKRSMESAVQHERLHVAWDEDGEFRKGYTEKWNGLTDGEKDEIVKSLRGYSREKESQLIEEWAVRSMELNIGNNE
ncbi:MAG: hypothetical protein LBP92_13195 [Deltaproteobacteria bacterium]|jgi:hypothetical protein|nr:hypothetical protein [Deltaproteobacteria bacterium]